MTKLLPLIFCIVLQACTSAPININYYLLHTAEVKNTLNKSPNVTTIVLAKIMLADYLRQNSLVLQVNKNELYYSVQDIWAESLESGISKALLTDLNQGAEDYKFVSLATPESESASYKLILEIEHFLATSDSTVIASGNYWLIDNATGKLIYTDNFYLQRELNKDGYAHSVEKLRELLNSLSEQITKNINNKLKQS